MNENENKPYLIVNENENNNKIKSSKLLFYGFYLFAGIVLVISIYAFRIDRYEFYLDNNEVLVDIKSDYQIKLTPKNAKYYDVSNYEYKTENPNVAVVSSAGIITSVSEGETNVIVKLKHSFSEKKLKVISKKVDVNSLKADTVSDVEVNGSSKVITSINGQDNVSSNVTYKSNDESVLSVDEYGNLRGIKNGDAVITVTANNGVTDEIKVKVNPKSLEIENPEINSNEPVEIIEIKPIETPTEIKIESIKMNIENTTLNVGDNIKLRAKISPANATDLTIRWTSSNESVAKVDNGGTVTASKPGSVTIKATTSNGKTAVCDIVVKEKAASTPTPTPTPTPAPPPVQKTPIRVATFNIGFFKCGSSGGCNASVGDITNIIRNYSIGIVGVQEAKDPKKSGNKNCITDNSKDTEYIRNVRKNLGYNASYSYPCNVNAILSAYGITSKWAAKYANQGTETRAIQFASININGIDVHFYNTHLGFHDIGAIQLQEVANILNSNNTNPIIVTGDWNRDASQIVALSPGVAVAAINGIDAIIVKPNGHLDIGAPEIINTGKSDHKLLISNLSVY